MRFAVLGPLEADDGGRHFSLGGPKQRGLLAMLLLEANRPVSRDRLIEGLWGESPPASAAGSLDSYLSRLRRLLGPDRLERRPPGYALRVEPGELDLERFEQLAARAREAAAVGDTGTAATVFGAALALWRGPALADVLYEPFAAPEADRLEEMRLVVMEDGVEAELANGAGVELLSELEPLVWEHPFRERLVGQLMVALYRAGRASAALSAYRAFVRRLADELGLEPGAELKDLERRILARDPDLDAPRRVSRPKRSSVWRAAAAVAGVAAAAATATGAVVATGSSHAPAIPPARDSRLLAVGARTGQLTEASELPAAPATIAAADGSLWIADASDQLVLRVDPRSGAVVDRIPVVGEPGSIVGGGGSVWVASTLDGTIERIDPATDTVSQTLHLGQELTSAIAFGHRSLWVADTTDHAVVKVDAASGTAIRTFTLDVRPTSLVVDQGALWVADHDAGSVSEVDLASGQTVATIPVGNGPSALALGAGALWVANGLDSTVSRIDPETSSVVSTIVVGSGPSDIAVAGGSVWVASEFAGTVDRIDPHRNAVAAATHVGGSPAAVTTAAGLVWVGAGPGTDLHRGGALVLSSSSPPESIDPAFYSGAATPQFTGLAFDTLVTFAKTSGPDGLRLVPDLALQVPQPTDLGTTYRFRLRPGIRYSDGRVLRASDFRRSFERLFAVGGPGVDDYNAIVGADSCVRHPVGCDLTRGVAVDDSARAVVFHLSRPDPDFLYKLADFAFSAPLPRGVPEHDAGLDPLPGTGPYRIVRTSKKEILFARNPFFREWSRAAQPTGNPDRIIWRFSGSHAQEIRWVESGRADWTLDIIAGQELRAIRARAPSLLHSNPIFALEFLPLNTHIAPFNDRRVRQALNLAIDRRRIARMYGGSYVAEPTCQALLPGLIGYRRYCPYTRQPNSDGAYHGPDLARARRLVEVSGTRGERVDVWGASDEAVVPRQESAYVGRVLRSLGYHVRIHLDPFASITEAMRRRHQISTDGDWLPSYPAPSSYLPTFMACGGSHGNTYVCNRSLDAEMAHALSLELSDPRRAAALWARVDHRVTDEAYWVPTVADRLIDLVSRRVHDYQFNPVWGFLPDQAWVN